MIDTGMEIKITNISENSNYRTRVADYNERDMMVEVPIDINTGKSRLFNKGTEFEVVFIGKDGALYQYRTRLMAKKRDNIPLLVIGSPNPKITKRIQRRENVRVPDSLNVSLHVSEGVISAMATNISAGGMAIRMKDNSDLHIGEEITCEFLLPYEDHKDMVLVGEVVRVIQDKEFIVVSLEFKGIDNINQKIITKYVFSRQIELRRKGFL